MVLDKVLPGSKHNRVPAQASPKQAQVDKRERYYRERVRHHGRRYRAFHRPSVELLLNLLYTYDVTASHFARRIGRHGLSISAFNALMILNQGDRKGCPLHELGELLLVSRANITGLVDSLARKGLVERAGDEGDRRVRIARITKAGEALLDSILPDHYAEVREVSGGLSNKERAALRDLLTKLRYSVQRAIESREKGTPKK